MKLIKLVNLMAVVAILATGAVGCKKKPGSLTNLPGSKEGPVIDDSLNLPLGEPSAHKDWPENREIFAANTVYFAFDSSTLKKEEKNKIKAVAEYLRSNPATAVRLEGHCDERGTEEYNRALGERRALAARVDLVGMGIQATRIDTLSFGEDRPAATGHEESSWQKNRRAEFILLTPPAK